MSAKYCIFDPPQLVFVRLLLSLIFNVFACLSVLLSCRSLYSKCCLRMEAKQKNPGSAIERIARERLETRLSTPTLEPKEPTIKRINSD